MNKSNSVPYETSIDCRRQASTKVSKTDHNILQSSSTQGTGQFCTHQSPMGALRILSAPMSHRFHQKHINTPELEQFFEIISVRQNGLGFCIVQSIAQIKNIFDMQANKSNLETKLRQLTQKMAQAAGKAPEELTKVEQTVIFAHALNQEFGLQCIARNGDRRYFPDNWNQASEGVYKFNYTMSSKEGSKDNAKVVQFRFINNQQPDGAISINYSLQDSEELHQYELKFEKDKIDQYSKAYQKHLEEKLKPKSEKQEGVRQNILQPQWKEPTYQQPRQPYPLFIPNQPTNPFNLPYGGGEYVGPDSEIFRGRGTNNPFGPIGTNPHSINDPRRPIGSRYDPIDPFNSQGVDEKPRSGRDFMGFNQFGQPYSGNKSGFNPGRFL